MREEKTFRVVVFRFETDASTNYTRYMITKNYMPFFPGNQWLELKSIRKTSTGKEYAKKLVAFLNWLDSRKVTYENATNHHVREFLHELVFGNLADEKVLSLQSSVGYSTLTKYVTVITGFYGWLDDMRQTEMLWKKKSVQANCSFLYGQIYSREYRYLIDGYAARLKSSRDYTKWYDKATKELLCRNFNTLRDEAVLRLTFEGFRIDEVLSVTLDSYPNVCQLKYIPHKTLSARHRRGAGDYHRIMIRWKLSSRQRYSTSHGRVANVQSGLPCAAQRHSHSASHDLPIFGAPASRCSPCGSRSSTTKETGS